MSRAQFVTVSIDLQSCFSCTTLCPFSHSYINRLKWVVFNICLVSQTKDNTKNHSKINIDVVCEEWECGISIKHIICYSIHNLQTRVDVIHLWVRDQSQITRLRHITGHYPSTVLKYKTYETFNSTRRLSYRPTHGSIIPHVTCAMVVKPSHISIASHHLPVDSRSALFIYCLCDVDKNA